MTVGIILAGKGREVVTIEPGAISQKPRSCSPANALVRHSFLGPTIVSSALFPSAMSCGLWPRAALLRSMNP